jgi:hypothetical protein
VISTRQYFNHAARFAPWIVLVDLDAERSCVPTFIAEKLPSASLGIRFRVAVRAVESWILADGERLASFLGVPKALIPSVPDSELNPKGLLIQLARRSSKKQVRLDIVPPSGGTAKVGPLYKSRLLEFIQSEDRGWRVEVAAQHSTSLRRCLNAVHGFKSWRVQAT